MSSTTQDREAFEAAVALTRQVLFEGVTVNDIANGRGVAKWQVTAPVVQAFTNAMFDFARVGDGSAEISAAIDALKAFDLPDEN